MKILIIGASGLVGSNCLKHFNEKNEEVLGTYYSFPTPDTHYFNTLDLNDEKNINLDEFNPDVIIHTGALTFVDYCEDHTEESYDRTVKSTLGAIELGKKYNAKMVFISTDYVFDGNNGPYTETDEVNPLGIYAKHKLEAEKLVQKELPNSIILRVTSIYGNDIRQNNFISRIITQIEEGKEWSMNLPSDQYSTPINALDIAKCTYLLIKDNQKGIYNIASTDFVNRVQLAKRVLSYFPTHKCTIIPTLTQNLNQKAKRPLMGGLLSGKFMAEYPEFVFSNIDDYLKQRLQK